jgi:hypothetical protein
VIGSLVFVAFGDETSSFFTGVACLGWLSVTILLWVRYEQFTDSIVIG